MLFMIFYWLRVILSSTDVEFIIHNLCVSVLGLHSSCVFLFFFLFIVCTLYDFRNK